MKKSSLYILAVIFVIVSCKEEKDRSEVIASVNGVELTRNELNEMANSVEYSNKYKSEIIHKWVEQEVLYQEAIERDILESEKYLRIQKESEKELAQSILLERLFESVQEDYSKDDYYKFYSETQEDFTLNDDAFLFNMALFNNENSAIEFRRLLLTQGWKSVVGLISKSEDLQEYRELRFMYKHEVSPVMFLRALDNLYPDEISIVLKMEPDNYMVVQMVNKFEKGTIPEFDQIKQIVETRYRMLKRKQLYSNFYKELLSKYNVEIVKDYE